ncbi:Glucose-6-phosphate isomerase [uncultured archaeon]|nr:Glucose-6-phosphate isomerase [uncultured archaeon]
MKIIDLRKASGLPLKINLESSRLIFGKGMRKVAPEARTRKQMMPVLKEPAMRAPDEFYYMHRNVCLRKDAARIKAAGLRYDVTVLPPFTVGEEFNKTFGHRHPCVLGTKVCYPEVYEVLTGRAHFLLQSESEFIVFDAREGDKCVMLPGFGHVTVNPSPEETLVMANWVCPSFKSDYSEYEQHGGSQWFDTAKGFVENRKYVSQAIRLMQPRVFPEFGLTKKPMYAECMHSPKRFEWLVRPQNYLHVFSQYREY